MGTRSQSQPPYVLSIGRQSLLQIRLVSVYLAQLLRFNGNVGFWEGMVEGKLFLSGVKVQTSQHSSACVSRELGETVDYVMGVVNSRTGQIIQPGNR